MFSIAPRPIDPPRDAAASRWPVLSTRVATQCIAAAVLLGWLSVCSVGMAAVASEAKLEGRTMGTTYHAVVGYDGERFNDVQVKSVIDQRLSEINSLMSTYDPKSELSTFNQSESTDWFEVSPETAKVVSAALIVAKNSDGAYDPTVGPLVNLWGFGPDGRRKEPPGQDEIDEALSRIGYHQVEARLDPPAIRKSNPRVYLDLSSIAKGYASDAVIEALADGDQGVGCTYAMVEVGGEIATLAAHPDGRPWQLAIDRPDENYVMENHVVPVSNGDALATSGDYRNFFESEGKRYSHTIDTKTGRPTESHLATVTVRTPTCMEADALATALMAMGADKGFAWASEQNIAALLVERTDEGFSEQATPAWQAHEAEAPTTPTKAAPMQSNLLTYFLITAAVFGIAVVAMAVGVIFSNRCLKGTCGGLAGMQGKDGKTACELCSNPSPTCSGRPDAAEPAEDESVNS